VIGPIHVIDTICLIFYNNFIGGNELPPLPFLIMESLVHVLFQHQDGTVEHVYSTPDLEAAEDYVDLKNDQLAELGLPGCWATSEGR